MGKNVKGICFTVAGSVCWGLSGVTGNYLFEEKGFYAVWLVALRMLTAGICLLFLAFREEKWKIFRVWKEKETAMQQCIFGLFGIMFCQMSYFLAIQYSNAGIATVLHYIAPALVMLFFLVTEKRRPKKLEVIVLFLVSTGVFLITTHGDIHSLEIAQKALFWGIASAIFLAVYNIQPKKLLGNFGLLATVGWGMLIGGVMLAPIVKIWNVPGIWDFSTILLILGIIVYGTIVPFACYLKGVVFLGPVKASMFACIEPLVSMGLSVTVLGKVFGIVDLFGMICIIGGVTGLAIFGEKE